MLLILNFFSVTFAYIALGVVLAALCLALSVPRWRQGVSVWLCLVGAVVACVTFIVGVHAAYLPQQKLVGAGAVLCDRCAPWGGEKLLYGQDHGY